MQDSITNKIKSLIESSQSVGVLLGKDPQEHELLLREVLLFALSEKNPVLPENLKNKEVIDKFEREWSGVLPTIKKTQPLKQKTSIRLPKNKYKIEEVALQEKGEYLSLLISGNKSISKEDIFLEKPLPEADLVFCLFKEPESFDEIREQIEIPDKKNIVFVVPDKNTLSKKIFEIIKTIELEEEKRGEIATLLFSALVLETNGFCLNEEEIFSLAENLLKSGAKKEKIEEILEKEKGLPNMQILGRTLARTRINDNLETTWSFLNEEDFKKTKNTDISISGLHKIALGVKKLSPTKNFHVVFWQKDKEVRALVIKGKKEDSLSFSFLSQKAGEKTKKDYFVSKAFSSFSEAEIYFKDLLRNNIS